MRIAATLLVCFCAASSTQAQQRTAAQRVIDVAARALGGAEAIRSVRTLVLEGIGDNFFLGQNPKPDAPPPRFEVTEFRRTIDLKSRRWWQDQTREPRFAIGNPARTRQINALDGDIAFEPGTNGNGVRASAEVANARRHELYQYPLTILQLALGDDAKLSDVRQVENEQLVTVSTAAGLNLILGIASKTNLPTRVSFKTNHPNLGDVESTVEFSEYRTVGELELPHRLIAKIDGVTVADIKLARTRVNPDIGDLAAPAELRAAAPAEPAIKVEVEELANGVWRLGGGSHHSIVIEFRDHLMMIEAPLGDARTMAVIQRARELRPNKPLTRVVMTHHHFDHSAGIRAAVAENLAIITHEGNVAFVREMLGRPHTIAPDELSRRPNAEPRIYPIQTQDTVSDGVGNVQLHHLAGNPHAQTMLIAYLPEHRMLVQADIYSSMANAPAALTFPFARNLVDYVKRLDLTVQRVVGIHGGTASWVEVEAAAGK